MSAHDYHEGLPRYSRAQVLHDGCGECETRGRVPWDAIARLDRHSFARAWARAARWNKAGLADISVAESDVLRILWVIQIQLERRGFEIGRVPDGSVLAALRAGLTPLPDEGGDLAWSPA